MTRTAAIVGAGVGGLSAALGLLRAGWEVTVLERWPEVVGHGAALGLWPEAQDALSRLGLADELHAVAVPYLSAHVRTPDGGILAPLPLERIRRAAGRPVVLVSRTTLTGLLHAAVRASGVEVRVGTRIEDPAALGRDHDVVVGADGLRSAVRAAFFGDRTAPRHCGFTAWRGSVSGETGDYGEAWGAGKIFGVTPLEAGRTNWYAAVRGERPREDAHAALRDLRRIYAGWASPVADVLAAADPATVLQNEVHDLAPALKSYVAGNVVLVGDAAHAMTPMLGQGACQALIDGEALAVELAGRGDVGQALRAYDHRRRRPTQRFVSQSAAAARVSLARRGTGARNVAVRLSRPFAS